MGVTKFLLKVILIPIVLVVVVAIGIILLVKVMKSRNAREDEIEAGRRGGFQQPPPLTDWAVAVQQQQAAMVQKPEAVAYNPHSYVEVQPSPAYAHQQ
jgi:flagellar basal body-associated protein FliL